MKFFGLEIAGISKFEALNKLDTTKIIFTPNPEILLFAKSDKKFMRILKKADLLLPDGNGLLLTSTLKRFKSKWQRFVLYLPLLFLFLFNKKYFKKEIPEIIHGSDFMARVIDWADLRDKSVFFLGAKSGIAEETANFFQKRNPNLKIAGYSNLNPGREAFKKVKDSKAKVLFVAYGAPKQEEWIDEYAHKIPGLNLAMSVGGSFDFYSGRVKRAPLFMRRLGLEWLWRLILNPKKRFRRIYNAFVKFPIYSVFFDS